MATEFKMIEPFEPHQVKELDGRQIVSYGTSSYGYDIRCADEFKLFTNINSTIVDPKEFNAKNFVDVKADSVLIPPNSPTALPWHARLNISAFPGMYSQFVLARAPTPGAGF